MAPGITVRVESFLGNEYYGPVQVASVVISGNTVMSNYQGKAFFPTLNKGTYSVKVSAQDHTTTTKSLTFTDSAPEQEFRLPRIEAPVQTPIPTEPPSDEIFVEDIGTQCQIS